MADHVIQRQRFDLHFATADNIVAEQDRFTSVYEQRVLPALERVFDRLAGPDVVIQLDALTIDLGDIAPDATDVDLAEIMLQRFTQQITLIVEELRATQPERLQPGGALGLNPAAPITVSVDGHSIQQLQPGSVAGSTLELLRYFLRHGSYPWWAVAQPVAELVETLRASAPESLVALIRTEAVAATVRKRMVRQLPAIVLRELSYLLLEAEAPEVLKALVKALKALPWKKPTPSTQVQETLAAKLLFEFAVSTPVGRKQLPEWVATTLPIVAPRVARQHGIEPEKKSTKKALDTPETEAPKQRKAQETYTPDHLQYAPEEGLYVTNAGVVMLWPFLEMFFTDLGLLKDQAWASEHEQESAALMLQLLATGQQEAEEHELLLNKALVGLPLDHPLPLTGNFSDEDQEKAQAVLRSVIKHWGALGEVSPAQLQHSFLMREGRLRQNELDWELKVEQKGYDIMLDRLPWGLSTVMLPWLEGTLHVEWA